MLKSILMIWLITCTVGYGSVWAFDGHIDGAAEHQELIGDMDHAPNDDGDNPACDHCCHASAHLTGMWANQPGISIPDTNTVWPHYHNLYFSILTGPPGHPPKA